MTQKSFCFFFFRKRRFFFFEKKKQKTFALFALFAFAPPTASARVVSLNLCTDQLLVLLAPKQVAALEPLARDPSLSFVASAAKTLPTVRADAEAVLNLQPDLVLAGQTGALTTVALLRQRGLHVVQFDEPQTFLAIEAQIARLAALLGVEQRGAILITRMQAQLAALPHPPRGRALFWEAAGWTAGPGTLTDAVLRAAGWQDAGTGGRMGVEAVLAAKPDLLVTDAPPKYPSMATDLARHPALHALPRRSIDPALLICGGPFTVEAAEILAQ